MMSKGMSIRIVLPLVALAVLISAVSASVKTVTRDAYTYEGGVSGNKFNGFGVCRYRNGNVYAGFWDNDFKSGLGKMIYADGTIDFGNWKRGRLETPRGQNFRPGKAVYGIDVAKYQGRIDWTVLGLRCDASGKVLTQGGTDRFLQPVMFAFMKSTQGVSIIDPWFKRNFSEAGRVGIVRGAYHFFTPGADARAQAEYFIANTPLEIGDLPPVLDLEIDAKVMKSQHKQIIKKAKEWCRIIEKHYGCKPIIYTYDNYYREYIKGHGLDHYDCWLARYRADPPTAKHWEFWQFTDKGRTRGISNHTVDIDKFNGNYHQFLKYLKKKGVKKVTPR